jgi:hypothetical protein
MFKETIKIIKSLLESQKLYSIFSKWNDNQGNEHYFNEILFDYEKEIKNRHNQNVLNFYPNLVNEFYVQQCCEHEVLIKNSKVTTIKKIK